jgi:phosphatidylinositol-3,4,5-trisphosphate 5-phosphatase 2
MSHYANVRWSWYHGVISRVDCEQLLAENAQDGAFLVRSSETVKGAYVLSVWNQNRIVHYRIVTDEENMLILQTNRQGAGGRSFSNLGDLVTHYQGFKHGLCTSLLHPIEPKDDADDDDSDNDEDDDSTSETTSESIGQPNSTDDVVSTFLLHSLAKVHTDGVSPEYVSVVRDYLRGGVKRDIEDITHREPLLNLKQLFQKRITALTTELDVLKAELQVLQAVFDRAIGAKDLCTGAEKTESVSKDSYDSLPFKLRECSAAMEALEKTAVVACRDLAVHVMGTQGIQSRTTSISMSSRPTLSSGSPHKEKDKRNSRMDDVCFFDVTLDTAGGLQTSKRTMKVSMSDGTLSIIKGVDEGSAQVYRHDEVKQLINSRSKERKLGLILAGQNRKDINFETLKAREHFCQVIRLMKKTHQKGAESQDSITIYVGTFNMGDSSFPPGIDSWYQCHGWGITMPRGQTAAHDIYAIGTQESPSDKDLAGKVKAHLKKLHNIDYEKVGVQSLWGIKLFVFVKPEHSNKISHVQGSQVRTGIGNALGNKGAVGISFTFGNTSLCFINCHLTSGNEKCTRRNQNYHDILKGLSGLKQARQISTFDLTHQFHHLFWFGDLNYRIDLPATNIVENAREKRYELLLLEDQLQREKNNGKIFADFREEVIDFPPTYRFYRGRRTVEDYDIMKPKGGNKFLHRKPGLYEVSPQAAALQVRINVPSYCDRVLWKSYPGTRIRCLSYGCTSDIMTSDHSPVFATFQISDIAPYAAPTTGPNLALNSKAEIIVTSCSASILTSSKTAFYIEIYSSCFEGVHRSSPNPVSKDPIGNSVRPSWEAADMPREVYPVVSDQKYLEMQHILLSIRSSESDEVYGNLTTHFWHTVYFS